MPLGALLPIAMGAASLIGGAITNRRNRKAQIEQNYQDREHEKYMYTWQRHDALADWNRENAYNSPEQQMTRLRQAGLNPHLVYGKGADATGGHISNVSPTPSSKMAPMWRDPIPNALTAFQNMAMVTAQTDNLNQQTAIGKQQELLTQAQTAKTITDNARGQFELAQAKDLRDLVVERAKLENEKLDIENEVTLNRDAREELANSSNVALTLQKVLTEQMNTVNARLQTAKTPEEIRKLQLEQEQLRVAIQNAQNEGVLKQFDADMRKQGIDPRDPVYIRLLMKLLSGIKPYAEKHFPSLYE